MHYGEKNPSVIRQTSGGPRSLVVIAASTGGPQALTQILPRFPSTFPGTIIVVQHMRRGFTRVLADELNHSCKLPIHEPADGDALQASRILVVPAVGHLTISSMGESPDPEHMITIESLSLSPKAVLSRADVTMTSAARIYGKQAVGVLLTGVGDDGREGMRAIRDAGGCTIAQDEPTSVVFDLPSSAIDAGLVQDVLPLWNIADRVIELVMGGVDAIAA
ncbi:MAG: CheB methylesterase domain-containing protein [Armatimonadetes bacterium]|nr:CheB methylesterase domain-containing protein [Armatimonadota bacterium]